MHVNCSGDALEQLLDGLLLLMKVEDIFQLRGVGCHTQPPSRAVVDPPGRSSCCSCLMASICSSTSFMDMRPSEDGSHSEVAAVTRSQAAIMFLASNICWVSSGQSAPGTAGCRWQ